MKYSIEAPATSALQRVLWILLCSVVIPTQAMVFDNRYFPLLQYPYLHKQELLSHATGDFFISTGSIASDNAQRDIGIPEIFGSFDQSQLAYSFDLAGIFDPLPPAYLDGTLPWNMQGKIQAQGFAASYQQALGCGFFLGVLALAMRSNSSIDFFFDASQASGLSGMLTETDILQLDEIRRAMFSELGLRCNHVHQAGVGDTELYLRWADHYYYTLKFRSINYGIQLGGLVPTGVKKNIFQPASVAFGGNGFWGIYASADAEFEIKEDWRVGFLLRGSKRFSKVQEQRMPAGQESQLFGVIVGPAKIDPGFTQIAYLYAQWEGIREGLGIRAEYTVINHWNDHWTDEREMKTPAAHLENVERHSAWASEYGTLTALYDFSLDQSYPRCYPAPIVKVAWDIPFTLLVAHRSVKSYKVSLGLEFNF